MNKNAVCITVYKNRFDGMLKRIESIDKNFDVFIVSQENDPNLDEYYAYNAEVLVPKVTSIFQKREYIRNEMINRGYEGFFMFDDDIKSFTKITDETKRTTSDSYRPIPADFNEVLHKIIQTTDDNNCSFGSIIYSVYIGFQKPNSIKINKSLSAGQAVYFKTDALKKYNIHYDESGDVNEDVDIVLKLLQHGCNCVTLCDYSFIPTNLRYGQNHMSSTTLYSGIEDIELMNMNNCVKWNIGIKLSSRGILTNVIRFNKYFNTFELPKIDDTILNFCKNKDILGLKAHLKRIKDEKN